MEPSNNIDAKKIEEYSAFLDELNKADEIPKDLNASYKGRLWSALDNVKSYYWNNKSSAPTLTDLSEKINLISTILSHSPQQAKRFTEGHLAKIYQSMSTWTAFHSTGTQADDEKATQLQEVFTKLGKIQDILKSQKNEEATESLTTTSSESLLKEFEENLEEFDFSLNEAADPKKIDEFHAFLNELNELDNAPKNLNVSYIEKIWSALDNLKKYYWTGKNAAPTLAEFSEKIKLINTIFTHFPEQAKEFTEEHLTKIQKSLSHWTAFNSTRTEAETQQLEDAFKQLQNIQEQKKAALEKTRTEGIDLIKASFKAYLEENSKNINQNSKNQVDVRKLLSQQSLNLHQWTETPIKIPSPSSEDEAKKEIIGVPISNAYRVDVERQRIITLNQQPIATLDPEIKEIVKKNLQVAPDKEITRDLIFQRMWDVLGQNSTSSLDERSYTLYNLSRLLTQGTIAELTINFYADLLAKIQEKNPGIHMHGAKSYFHIKIDSEIIQIDNLQPFVFQNLEEKEYGSKERLNYGYIIVKREIKLSRKELEHELPVLNIQFNNPKEMEELKESYLPSVEVTDTYTSLYPDLPSAFYQLGIDERGLPLAL